VLLTTALMWGEMMRKRFLRLVLLALITTIMTISSVLMMRHTTSTELLRRMDSGAIGEVSALLSIHGANLDKSRLFEVAAQTGKSIGIYEDREADNGTLVRLVFYTDVSIQMPMISGRFFSRSDFDMQKYVAVAGKNVTNLVEANGSHYFTFADKEYEVVGRFGSEASTVWDNYILLNATTEMEGNLNGLFVIDIFSPNSDRTLDRIADSLRTTRETGVELLAISAGFISNFLPKLASGRWLVLSILGHFVAFCLICADWTIRSKREIAILLLVGIPPRLIIRSIICRFSTAPLASALISCSICALYFPAYLRVALQVPMICFLTGLTTVMVIARSYTRTETSEVLS